MECTSEGCDRPVKNKKRGLCKRCYQFYLQTESPWRPRCDVTGCDRPICRRDKVYCGMHQGRADRSDGDPLGVGRGRSVQPRGKRNLSGRYTTGNGYVKLRVGSGEWVLEHRYVMEQHLGRPLYKGESVHHKNGDKQNNDISNLELWASFQPNGQRVEDLLEYAKEIIRRYDRSDA